MSDFFANLLDRHLGRCDTIQPRIPGRFEMDQTTGSVALSSDGITPVVSENQQNGQSPQSASAVMQQWSQERSSSDVHHPESTVSNSHSPVESPTIFSSEAAKTAIHEPDSVAGKEFLSASLLTTDGSSLEPGITEQPATRFGFVEPEGGQRLDFDKNSHPKNITQQQPRQTNRVIFDAERDALGDSVRHTGGHKLDEVTAVDYSPAALPVDKHSLEQTLNQRIGAVLQQLADPPMLSATEPAPNERGHGQDERLTAPPVENTSRLDVATSPEVVTPAVNAHAESKQPNDNPRQGEPHRQLEAPIWLSEVAAQLNPHSQQNEAKAEPVINVTIGRVDVRAVPAETEKNRQTSKKPTGVMTLNEYLKRREGGGAK